MSHLSAVKIKHEFISEHSLEKQCHNYSENSTRLWYVFMIYLSLEEIMVLQKLWMLVNEFAAFESVLIVDLKTLNKNHCSLTVQNQGYQNLATKSRWGFLVLWFGWTNSFQKNISEIKRKSHFAQYHEYTTKFWQGCLGEKNA